MMTLIFFFFFSSDIWYTNNTLQTKTTYQVYISIHSKDHQHHQRIIQFDQSLKNSSMLCIWSIYSLGREIIEGHIFILNAWYLRRNFFAFVSSASLNHSLYISLIIYIFMVFFPFHQYPFCDVLNYNHEYSLFFLCSFWL